MKLWQFGMIGSALFFAVLIPYLATHVIKNSDAYSKSEDRVLNAKTREALNQLVEENRGNPYFQMRRAAQEYG